VSAAPDQSRPPRFEFEQIADGLPDGIAVCDREGGIVFVNAPLAELLGYRPAELVGLPVETLIPDRLRERHVSERRRYLTSPARRPMGLSLDIVARHRSGHEIPVEIGISQVAGDPAHLIAVVRDMTESLAMERAHRTEADLYQTIVETSNDLILVVTDELRVVFANSGAIELFESHDVPLVGRPLPADADPMLGALRTMLEGGGHADATVERELLLHDADGREVWVHVRVRSLRGASGAAIGSVVSIADVTERKRAEEVQRQLERDIRETQKLSALGRLAGGVAHDFNNILQVIGGTAEIIRDTTADDDLHEALGAITEAVGNGMHLSAQLLAYSAPGADEVRETDASHVAHGLLPFLDRLVGADVDVELHGAQESAVVGLAESEIEQILMNVVLNAGQAMTGSGTVTLGVLRAVETSVTSPGDTIDVVRITVADTGPGIDEDRLPHIFDPYFTSKAEGTGLGLAIVYRLVTEAGGRIAARNRDGGGAELVITIPLLI